MNLFPGHRRALTLASVLSAAVAVGSLTACTPDATRGPATAPPAAAPATAPATAVATAAATEPATDPELRRFYEQKPSWSACGDLQCATLTVPMDYRHPADGRTFTLPLIRAAATDPGRRIGSLVFDPGGPGGSGVAHLKGGGITSFTDALRARFDVVGFDPRGVAGSVPAVDCAEAEASAGTSPGKAAGKPSAPAAPTTSPAVVPTTEAERQAALDEADRSTAACTARSGEILPHVGTEDAARDLDVLRAALGDRQLSYLGWSYGTYLGTVYGELFPRRVRALVLDGAVDPAQDWAERALRSGAAFRKAVDDYADQCAAVVGKASCPADSPEAIRKLVADLYERTARKPLPVKDGNRSGARRLDQNLLHTAVTKSMYSPESQWKPLSEALRAAHRGDGTKLAALAGGEEPGGEGGDGGSGSEHPDNSDAALEAVNCLDIPHPADPQAYWTVLDRARRESGVFGAATVLAELSCRTWPQGTSTPHRVRADGLPPALVVGTTGDPATPYEDARSLAEQLPGGMLLTHRGVGHTAYGRGNDCVNGAVDAYLTELRPVPTGTTC
ncbi:alpha/beta hydrolase [Kitasatospora sp. NPDC093806]|uniref:alpha/beta hydrolase n=1 Tax=Kitasatospora sp. NPDC093806 TaxID=3155075 RepID=UPI003418A7FF